MALIALAVVAPALAAGLRSEATDPSHPVALVDGDDDSVGLDLLQHIAQRRQDFPATWLYAAGCDVFTSAEACEARQRNLTYLASFPASGNTWTRVLLQAATGIYTGSAYNDETLRKAGLLGEHHVEAREVIAVKTHEPCEWAGSHGSALVLVRHPLRAALGMASLNLTGESHSTEVPNEELRKVFTKSRAEMIALWRWQVKSWMECPGSHLIIRFEDIVADTYGVYVRQILPFFDIDTSNKVMLQRLRSAIDYSNGSDRLTRRAHTYKFHFTDEDRSEAQRVAGDVMEQNGYGPIYTA